MAFEIPNVLQCLVFCNNGATGAYNATPGASVVRTGVGDYSVTVDGWKIGSFVIVASNVGTAAVQAFFTPTSTGFTVKTIDVTGASVDAAWTAVAFNYA